MVCGGVRFKPGVLDVEKIDFQSCFTIHELSLLLYHSNFNVNHFHQVKVIFRIALSKCNFWWLSQGYDLSQLFYFAACDKFQVSQVLQFSYIETM